MTRKSAPVCGEHNVKKKWQETTFEYRENGIVVRVPKVLAWVCPKDGEISFTPETTDELIAAVRELMSAAKRAKKRRSAFTEYTVAIGR